MYYASNERDYFALSAGIVHFEKKHKSEKKYTEMYFSDPFFPSIIHISTNNVIGSVKCCTHVGNIHIEGTVSQIFFLYASLYFM